MVLHRSEDVDVFSLPKNPPSRMVTSRVKDANPGNFAMRRVKATFPSCLKCGGIYVDVDSTSVQRQPKGMNDLFSRLHSSTQLDALDLCRSKYAVTHGMELNGIQETI